MDKTDLTQRVAELFRISGHDVKVSVQINHREIDVVAQERQGLLRKTILVECADYGAPVGIDKFQIDLRKLESAQQELGHACVVMHVSRHGYSKEANGYAVQHRIDAFTLEDLTAQLVNFEPYIQFIEHNDRMRPIIMNEYQPTSMSPETNRRTSKPALQYMQDWLLSGERWLTVLGDYGVGKSWTLRRLLYDMLNNYKSTPASAPLPFFIPLQRFTKAFDFKNLVLSTFSIYGLSGVHYDAFEYLVRDGKVVFLLDSFDEMAQMLSRETLRENLKELLVGVVGRSKAIMTSRPTYFEGRAERMLLVDAGGELRWHQHDREHHDRQTALARFLSEQIQASSFVRLNDLSSPQREKLFRVVLRDKPNAYAKLMDLFRRFQQLDGISQRAVIARLLTTVAETLAKGGDAVTAEGTPLLPNDLTTLNQAKIFEIVVTNLLERDQGIGALTTHNRLQFLRNFAIYLQTPGHDHFATPDEIRHLVQRLFEGYLRTTDTPAAMLENLTRTCRRHSGLTTEGQFLDTSGVIDLPVDERDFDSRVGFSHNSLREYLVADTIADSIGRGITYEGLYSVTVSDGVGSFLRDIAEYQPELRDAIARAYQQAHDSKVREFWFKVVYQFIAKSPTRDIAMLGTPIQLSGVDICNLDLSSLTLVGAKIDDSIAADTDFRSADLRSASFGRTIIDRAMLDDARLDGADFTRADIVSIFVHDEFDAKTNAVLQGRSARQWLFSKGARVSPSDDLNPHLGKPWYQAAREVTYTIKQHLAGTHQEDALYRGTKHAYRQFAEEFVDFLKRRDILEKIKKSSHNNVWVVRLRSEYREAVNVFTDRGIIPPEFDEFFAKYFRERSDTSSN